MRVLVVDDDPDVTLVVEEALRTLGHLVLVARTGQEAIDQARSFQPDAAMVDVGLPDIDGVTLAELLRGAVPTWPVRIIALSGYPEDRLRAAVRRDMFDEFLLKPASLAEIAGALAGSRSRSSSGSR